MVIKLQTRPAFYRRVRHYRDRIAIQDARPQVANKFATAVEQLVLRLTENPQCGHSARFQTPGLTDILRVGVPGFGVFALFYRWDAKTLTLITVEHTAQDLPVRLAAIVSTG